MNAAQAVADAAQKHFADFADIPATDTAMFADPVYGGVLGRYPKATSDERNAVLRVLAPAIATADFYHTGLVAIICGSIVEAGADANIAVRAVLDRLAQHVTLAARVAPRVDTVSPERLFAENAEAFGAWRTLRFRLLAAMTMLHRNLSARQYARELPGLAGVLTEIEPFLPEADFLLQVLALTDGMKLVVLHPELRRGYRVVLEAIGRNFHLFTLLQAALIGDPAQGFLPGAPTDKRAVAVARGETLPTEDDHDMARFSFQNWFALKSDGTNIASWIWGEGAPAEIALLGGERIVLLGKSALASRSWQGFFLNIHDALRCSRHGASDRRPSFRLSRPDQGAGRYMIFLQADGPSA